MITVEVEEYCQDCMDFEPDVEKPIVLYTDTDRYALLSGTVIRCEHRQRCKTIASHIGKYGIGGYGGACYIAKCGENGNIDKKE